MIPTLTLKSGIKIPTIGLGTWMVGGDMVRNPQNDDIGQQQNLAYAIDNGISLIRTAQNYAEGHCEEIIGNAISKIDRSKIFLIVSIFEGNGIDKDSILRELSKSLIRLGTDYVDMLIIGGINPDVSLRKISEGLLSAKSTGLARSIGVGNYRKKELESLVDLLGDELDYNELHYNLIVREVELCGVRDYQEKHNIVLGAYRPLQLGQLARPGIDLLDTLANKYNKTQAEISLKWILNHKNTITFPKSLDKKHIDQIIHLSEWDIDDTDQTLLTNKFPIQMRISDCISPINKYIK